MSHWDETFAQLETREGHGEVIQITTDRGVRPGRRVLAIKKNELDVLARFSRVVPDELHFEHPLSCSEEAEGVAVEEELVVEVGHSPESPLSDRIKSRILVIELETNLDGALVKKIVPLGLGGDEVIEMLRDLPHLSVQQFVRVLDLHVEERDVGLGGRVFVGGLMREFEIGNRLRVEAFCVFDGLCVREPVSGGIGFFRCTGSVLGDVVVEDVHKRITANHSAKCVGVDSVRALCGRVVHWSSDEVSLVFAVEVDVAEAFECVEDVWVDLIAGPILGIRGCSEAFESRDARVHQIACQEDFGVVFIVHLLEAS